MRNLPYPFLIRQTADVAVGFRFIILFIHLIMGTSAGSYLRQMRDTDNPGGRYRPFPA